MAVITRSMSKRKRREDADVETNKSRIDELNDTLLEFIFSRLSPWKSLVISKCVSKRWNSIISNPDFTRQLTPQSFPFTLLLSDQFCVVTEHPYFQKHRNPLEFLPNSLRDSFVANTNDLIVAHYHQWPKEEYYLANPLTKQYVVVPITLGKRICKNEHYMIGIVGFVDGVSAANVSHRNNYNQGFRIVHIFSENSKFTFQIYSSETGQWKTYLFDCFDCPRMKFKKAITCNNKIYWMKRSKLVVIDPFNIDNVAPRVLNLPDKIGYKNSILGVSQNRLRIAQFKKTRLDMMNQRIKIWEVEDYDNVNDNLVKVNLVIDFKLTRSLVECTGIDCYDLAGKHKMVCCHPNDPQVVYFEYCNSIFYCNVVDKKCKIMGYASCYSGHDFVFVHPPLL